MEEKSWNLNFWCHNYIKQYNSMNLISVSFVRSLMWLDPNTKNFYICNDKNHMPNKGLCFVLRPVIKRCMKCQISRLTLHLQGWNHTRAGRRPASLQQSLSTYMSRGLGPAVSLYLCTTSWHISRGPVLSPVTKTQFRISPRSFPVLVIHAAVSWIPPYHTFK